MSEPGFDELVKVAKLEDARPDCGFLHRLRGGESRGPPGPVLGRQVFRMNR